jgi:hypothetical protein
MPAIYGISAGEVLQVVRGCKDSEESTPLGAPLKIYTNARDCWGVVQLQKQRLERLLS